MSDRDAQDITEEGADKQPAARDRKIRAIRNGSVPPAAPSHPRFSQPVRQIVLMLIVLALVGAGAWYAYGRVISIFSANPVLNGVIMGVFVLGALTCFWQVGQLVYSVSWIERFASHRRNAAENGLGAQWSEADMAPRLLAPLAALLGGGGLAGGVISTASSRSILDSVATRIDELRDITRYMSNLLIFLGLLGTFYGLAITVPAVVETIRALSPQEGESGLQVFDKLMSGLEGQLGGMGTAFSSSLLGLAGSLVVGLLELFVTHGQNRFYRELEEWMSSFTRVDMGEAATQGAAFPQIGPQISGFLDQLTGHISDLHHFYQTRDEARAGDAAKADARIMAMTGGIETLSSQLLAGTQDRIEGDRQQAQAMQAALLRIAETQEKLADRLPPDHDPNALALPYLERLTQAQEQQVVTILQLADQQGDLARQHDVTRQGQGQMTELQSALTEGQARIAEALAQLATGQAQIATMQQQAMEQHAAPRPSISEQEESDLIEARMHLRSLDYQLARLVEEMAAGRADMIDDLRADMAALTQAIRQLGPGHEA